jgi:hypothetical protein
MGQSCELTKDPPPATPLERCEADFDTIVPTRGDTIITRNIVFGKESSWATPTPEQRAAICNEGILPCSPEAPP